MVFEWFFFAETWPFSEETLAQQQSVRTNPAGESIINFDRLEWIKYQETPFNALSFRLLHF